MVTPATTRGGRIDQTAVFVVPVVESPRATLREIRPDGSTQSFVVEGRPLTIGRGADNGLVLQDTAHPATMPGSTAARVPCSWPISGARMDRGSTIVGSTRSPSAKATGSASETRSSVVESVEADLMDGFVVTIWVVRLLFLALLYLFLFGIARMLLRDLNAAAREPTAELGRLVVVASPAGEPAGGARSPSMRSRPSAATSTTRSSSTINSPRPSTPS